MLLRLPSYNVQHEWASTLITHKYCRKEQSQGKPKQKENLYTSMHNVQFPFFWTGTIYNPWTVVALKHNLL